MPQPGGGRVPPREQRTDLTALFGAALAGLPWPAGWDGWSRSVSSVTLASHWYAYILLASRSRGQMPVMACTRPDATASTSRW